MRPRVLVLGVTGMLGHVLMQEFGKSTELDVFGTARRVDLLFSAFPRRLLSRVFSDVDARDFQAIRETIERIRPDIVVNCIGVIKQDPGVTDRANTIALNALLPHLLAQECNERDVRLIHFSTDCVFSGQKGNYTEDDIPDPVDFYGQSKLLGEVVGPHALTLRTSIIGHELKSSRSLVDWFLSESGSVHGYTKAIYTGVTSYELARVLMSVVFPRTHLKGLFHVASDPISKFELLSTIAKEYRWPGDIVPSDEVACDRSLSAAALFAETGYRPPPWPEMVAAMRRSATVRGFKAR